MAVIRVFAPVIASAVMGRCVEFLAQAARAGPDRRRGLGRLGSRIKLPADALSGSMNLALVPAPRRPLCERREAGGVSVARNNTAERNSRAAPLSAPGPAR